MPLDVCAHLPVQFVEHFRTDQLVHPIGARLRIIPEAVGRHVPGAIIGLREPADYDTIKEDVALPALQADELRGMKTCLERAAHRLIERRITNPQVAIEGELHYLDVSVIESVLKFAVSFKTQFRQLIVRYFSSAEDLHQSADNFFGVAVH